jgi:aspartyl protease family protein
MPKIIEEQDDAGGGGRDSLHSTSMSMTVGMAAWAMANEKPAYAPLDTRDTVSGLSQVAQALNHELGLDQSVTPSPFGTSQPSVNDDDRKAKDAVQNRNVKPLSHQNAQGVKEVLLELNAHNSYVVTGTINGREVTFIVDTGASTVSIPLRIATYLGLKPQGRPSFARTANGLAEVYSVNLQKVGVGNIELKNVGGMINMGDTSEQILLGMTALKMLDFRFSQGKLILTQKPH